MEEDLSFSSSGSEATPRKMYRHEHPTFSFISFMEIAQLKDFYIQNPIEGAEGCREKENYISYVQEVRSLGNGVAQELYRELRPDSCDCFVNTRLGFCLHRLQPADGARSIISLRQDGVRKQLDANGVDIPHSVFDLADEIVNTLHPSQQRAVLRCGTCLQVVRSTWSAKLRRHFCDPENIKQFGGHTTARFETSFAGPNNTRVMIDTNAIMLSFTEFEYVVAEAYYAHVTLQRLGIDTNILQIVLQDPLFVSDLPLLLNGDFSPCAVTYYLYLYLRFRLNPLLKEITPEVVNRKFIPLFVMIERFHEGGVDPLILGDRPESILDRVNTERHLEISPQDRLRQRLTDLIAEKDTEYLNEQVYDGLSSSNYRSDYLRMIHVLGRIRPVTRGWRKFIEKESKAQGLSPFILNRNGFLLPPVNNTNFEWYNYMTNIFDVIPNNSFLRINREIGLLGILDSRLEITTTDYRSSTCNPAEKLDFLVETLFPKRGS